MATTIQVSKTTKQMLEILKAQEHAASYDALLLNLLQVHTNMPKSMFGADKGIKWKKEFRMDSHDLHLSH
ncbi:MAG: hypothetical protein AABX52_03015 [Nanoarchaeota archaeon]